MPRHPHLQAPSFSFPLPAGFLLPAEKQVQVSLGLSAHAGAGHSVRGGLRRWDSRAPGSSGHPCPRTGNPQACASPPAGQDRLKLALPLSRAAFRRREQRRHVGWGFPARPVRETRSARRTGLPRSPRPASTPISDLPNHSATPENLGICIWALALLRTPIWDPTVLGDSAPGPSETRLPRRPRFLPPRL